MKLETAPQDVAVHGNFETSDFKVGDIAFIVDMFADKVYSYKERAVIRELSCNAHDSHIMAETEDVPFDVHIPTQLEPYFSIRDYGTGLSDREVREHYAGIGISTKRDNNSLVGCYGIGTLSPYSLADSFTVKSYKDGVCRNYSCYRNELRQPVVSLLTESETNEDNGVEVSLTVQGHVYEFQKAAIHVFRFWEGTLPDINDNHVVETCKQQREKYVFTGEDYGMSPDWGKMVAIMGNITYTIPEELDEFQCDGYLKFELGELNFDSGRENLTMDDKTKEAIAAKFDEVKSKLSDETTKQIEALPTDWERAKLADSLKLGQLGRRIKTDLNKYDLPTTHEEMIYLKRNWRVTDKGETSKLPLGENISYYKFKPRFQTRIRSWLKDQDRHTIVLLTEKQISQTRIDPEIIEDLDDLPKIGNSSGYRTVDNCKVYKLSNNDRWKRAARDNWIEDEVDLKDDEERVYVEINRFEVVGQKWFTNNPSQIRSSVEELKEYIGDVKVYGVKSVLLKSKGFQNGNWISLDKYLKREITKVAPKSISKFTEDSNMAQLFCSLADMVDDERFSKFKNLYKNRDDFVICKVLDNLDMEVEKSDEINIAYKEIIDNHQIFDIIDRRTATTNLSTVAKYIQVGDQV